MSSIATVNKQHRSTKEDHKNYLQKHPDVTHRVTFATLNRCSNVHARHATQRTHEMQTSMQMPRGRVNTSKDSLKTLTSRMEAEFAVQVPFGLEIPELQVPDRRSTPETGGTEVQNQKGTGCCGRQ